MNRKIILKSAKTMDYESIRPLINLFIKKCIDKNGRDRWKQSSKSIDQLSLKFNSLWRKLAFDKSDNHSEVILTTNLYIYLNLDAGGKVGFVLDKEQAEYIGNLPHDGILISLDKTQAILLTHESEFYHFQL